MTLTYAGAGPENLKIGRAMLANIVGLRKNWVSDALKQPKER